MTEKVLGLGQRSPPPPFGGGVGSPPPPYSPANCRTPLGVTHWLAAAPVRTKADCRSMEGKKALVGYDNWYQRRDCSDPVRPNCCLNVTAMFLHQTTEIAMYPGFPTLDDLLQCISEAAQAIASLYREFP